MNRYLQPTSSYKFFQQHEEALDELMSNSDGALYDGTNLVAFIDDEAKEYTVREGTTRILDKTFSQKTKLENITLPNTLQIIGHQAFYRCGIREINRPNSIKCIKDEAFMNCKLLKKLDVPEGILIWGTTVFAGCRELETVNLPDDMYYIPDWTFFGNFKLKEIKLPSNLLFIGRSVFMACRALERIDLPKNVSSIGIAAFCDCGIKKIVFPYGLKRIDGRCFQSCKSLSEIIIPKQISFIGVQAFQGCPVLTIYVRRLGLKIKANKYFRTTITSSTKYYYNGSIKELIQY